MSFSKSAPVSYFRTILTFFVTGPLYTSVILAGFRISYWEIRKIDSETLNYILEKHLTEVSDADFNATKKEAPT